MTSGSVDESVSEAAATSPAGRRQASLLQKDWRKLLWGLVIFVVFFSAPLGWQRFDQSIYESLALTRWYAQEHVLLCLVPALFIAGAIAAFVSQTTVMKYLGPNAPKPLAYGVASVSGTILTVCSCTVLPLFAGIWRMGAGLGPATALLYSGPAINVLAIILTARVLGIELGIARAVGAIGFSVLIGLIMHLVYRREEAQKAQAAIEMPDDATKRPLWQTVLYFAAMIGILMFPNWGKPDQANTLWHAIWSARWVVTSGFAVMLAVILVAWFGLRWQKVLLAAVVTITAWMATKWLLIPTVGAALVGHHLPWETILPFAVGVVALCVVLSVEKRNDEANEWFNQTWSFTKQITPLLLLGVLIAGFLFGRPGREGLIPSEWVVALVGGNSIWSNLFASVAGAFMYFATLTEVPILQALIGAGMGKGPALALLLAGPALSLPNMLVIRSVLGTNKTLVYVSLVVVMATVSGMLYGAVYA